MYRCPTCDRTYDEDSPGFCPGDGSPLTTESPGHRSTMTEDFQGLGGKATWSASQDQIPGLQQYLDQKKETNVWPWVIGAGFTLVVLIALFAWYFML